MGEFEKFLKSLGDSYLPPASHLDIQVLDIDMAGAYEPWRAPFLNNTRFIRDVYRPRFELSYVLRDSAGHVVSEKKESVSDLNYLHKLNPAHYPNNDNLRYEKALPREWFETTFKR